MENKLKIGIIGLGTVGCGVVKVLNQFDDIEIVGAAVKNLSKKRDVEVNYLTDNVYDLINNPERLQELKTKGFENIKRFDVEKISEQLEVLLQKLSERRIVINDAHYGNIIFGKSGVTIIDPDHFYISNDHSISEIISKNREEAIKYLNDTIENEMYNSNLIDIYNIRLDRYVFIDNIDYSKSLVDIVRNNMGEENISKEYIKKYERYF